MIRFALALAVMLAFGAPARAQAPLALDDHGPVSARGESGQAQLFRFIAFSGESIRKIMVI